MNEVGGFAVDDTSVESFADVAARLAALSPAEYDPVRKEVAKKFRVLVPTLDAAVKAARGQANVGSGQVVDLPTPEPWPEPVGLADVLDEAVDAVRRHIVLVPEAAEVIALWAAHTWVYQRFEHTPRLGITSPAPRCGKSTLLDILRDLSCRAVKAVNITASGVFRVVDKLAPLTLLIDEAETFLPANEELRGVLNSGYERASPVIRVVEIKGEHQPVCFHTFAPVALAAIGGLPSTLHDRALPIRLQRKGASEVVEKLRDNGNRERLLNLARKLSRWASELGAELQTSPAMPSALGDREADISVALIAIADAAGGGWPDRARRALLAVFERRIETDGLDDNGSKLLADIRDIFIMIGCAQLSSAAICEHLKTMEDRPWPELKNGKPITPTQLATMLRPYGLGPTNIRLDGCRVAKGYRREDFEDAWSRYLAPLPTTTVR
jgi:putative DNA primase/helicase